MAAKEPRRVYCNRFVNNGNHVLYYKGEEAVCCGRTREQVREDTESMRRGIAAIKHLTADLEARAKGKS